MLANERISQYVRFASYYDGSQNLDSQGLGKARASYLRG